MFTGLVEETGRVVNMEPGGTPGGTPGGMARLEVSAGLAAGDDARVGDSVAVNGVCLTINEKGDGSLAFYAMPETLRRTALGGLVEGSLVNLERAMSPADRFGGHIVQGHVDGVGEVSGVRPEGGESSQNAEIWEFAAPAEAVLRYTVEKGSACVDGISLTVVSVGEASFTVSILPQTRRKTNLRELAVGDRVNLEADVIGKYVERLLGPRTDKNLERSV